MKKKDLKTQLEKIKALADQQETLAPLEEMLLNFCELLLELNAEKDTKLQALENQIYIQSLSNSHLA